MPACRSAAPLTAFSALLLVAGTAQFAAQAPAPEPPATTSAPAPAPRHVFGFVDFTRQAAIDAQFLAVPDPAVARQELKTLTAAPHWASSPQDYATALYVADHFKAAGLQTEIVPYSVLLGKPTSILVEAFDAAGHTIFTGPTAEHVALAGGPTNQNAPDVIPGYNSSSPSGEITAPIVYVNYGRPQDFQRVEQSGISLQGKIALIRYGQNFRGVKAYLAQKYGAKGVLLYSDPADDGSHVGPAYPEGRWRPDSGVQRGSVQFLPAYPGDPTTPGIASTPDLPASRRIPADKLQTDQPSIPVLPLSAVDAAPILRALTGPVAPHEWQGGLPLAYHLGSTGSVTVHMSLAQDVRLRTIWDVIGRIPGSSDPNALVIAGNHRDAWVFGASDPSSGTVALLEAARGLGTLLQHGWRPRRTIVLASWDAEEEGLMGSTEWVEQFAPQLSQAVAYLNIDVAVSGPTFNAASAPSLRQFLRDVALETPSAAGGTVFEQWRRQEADRESSEVPHTDLDPSNDLRIGDLGSGSDYTPFFQHVGVPSTDIGSDGPFGVYHTLFDNYDWFSRFADPNFTYVQQQARFLGLEVLHMADADVLPYDYRIYAEVIERYLNLTHTRATARNMDLDFNAALTAAQRFAAAARTAHELELTPPADPTALNRALAAAERDLLLPEGLPLRPWYRHSIYAPGEFTGYAAIQLPGINDAIDAADPIRAQAQLTALAHALDRAATTLSATAH